MPGYLIKDTTREEREQLVAESLGNIHAIFALRPVTGAGQELQRCIRITLTEKKN